MNHEQLEEDATTGLMRITRRRLFLVDRPSTYFSFVRLVGGTVPILDRGNWGNMLYYNPLVFNDTLTDQRYREKGCI